MNQIFDYTSDSSLSIETQIIMPRLEKEDDDIFFEDDIENDFCMKRKMTVDSLQKLCDSSNTSCNLEDNLNFEFDNNPFNIISSKCTEYLKGNDVTNEEFDKYFKQISCNSPPRTTLMMRQFSSIQQVDQEFLQSFLDGEVNLKEITVGGAGYSRWFIFRNTNGDLWIVSMSVDSYVCLCGMKCSPGYDNHSRIEFRETSREALINLLWGVPYGGEKIIVDREFLKNVSKSWKKHE
jgi:hypothetical protein